MSQNICGRDITARMDTKFKIIDLSFMKNLTFYAQSIWPCDIEHDMFNNTKYCIEDSNFNIVTRRVAGGLKFTYYADLVDARADPHVTSM